MGGANDIQAQVRTTDFLILNYTSVPIIFFFQTVVISVSRVRSSRFILSRETKRIIGFFFCFLRFHYPLFLILSFFLSLDERSKIVLGNFLLSCIGLG